MGIQPGRSCSLTCGRGRRSKDFAETIDAAHVSGNSGRFVGHWSATFLSRANGERRPIKGYVAAVLERRNGEWKARIHITNYER